MPTLGQGSIFVHIPKCGGTSISSALRTAGITFGFDGVGIWDRLKAHPRNAALIRQLRMVYPVNSINGFPEAHLPASLLREFVPVDSWNRSFKFAFVRNPFELVVSTYFFLKQHEHFFSTEVDYAYTLSRGGFYEFACAYPTIASDMSAMIVDGEGNDLVDFVGRFETIAEDFAAICERLALDVPLPHLNSSAHGAYRDYYNAETKAVIGQHFARDIDRFEYAF